MNGFGSRRVRTHDPPLAPPPFAAANASSGLCVSGLPVPPAHEFFDTPAETHFPPFDGLSIHPFASKRACQDNFFVGVSAGSHPAGHGILVWALGMTDWLLALQSLHVDRKSTRLNSSHIQKSRMPSSA